MSARPPRPTRSVDRARAQIAPVRTGDGWRAIAPLMGPPPAKPETGPAPRLEWIEVGKLVVEESYQREIGERGLKNIGEIVRNFRWSRFTPVIVAPREDGLYALIDGQHRATAAATLRIGEVPAQIVDMGPEERTEAFSYINGAVTALSAMATFHAAVAARIQAAVAAQRALDAAGARVLRYPLAAGRMAPGDTCAAGALMKAADTYGDAALSAALKGLVAQGKGGILGAAAITAFARYCAMNASKGPEALAAAIAAIDAEKIVAGGRQRAAQGGVTLTIAIFDEIAGAIAKGSAAAGASRALAAAPPRAGHAVSGPARAGALTDTHFNALLVKAGVAFGCDRHQILDPGADARAADAQVALIAFLDKRGCSPAVVAVRLRMSTDDHTDALEAAPAIAKERPKEWARFEALAREVMP